MPGKAILHRKNVFCNLSRHTIASIKAIHIIESSHPREDFLFPRPQAHQQINPAAAMQHTTTRFQVCTDRSQVLFNSGGNDYGILQLCDRSSSDPGCGPGCGPGCLGCHQSSGRLWQRQPRLQCSCTVEKHKTWIASPATIPKSGERNRKIHSCMLYLISI